MKKRYYYKLIRDKIPQKIKAEGSTCQTTKLGIKEFEKELKKKLIEEAVEVVESKDQKELTKELGDVLDVWEEIRKLKRISLSEIKTAQKEASRKKGGFKKRLYLIWSSDDGYKSNKNKRRASSKR